MKMNEGSKVRLEILLTEIVKLKAEVTYLKKEKEYLIDYYTEKINSMIPVK